MKLILLITVLLAASAGASAQTAPADGSLAGRVTVGGKPAPNVIVMLTRAPADPTKNMAAMFEAKAVLRTTTDGEGVYRFEHVTAGRYALSAYAPAYVAPPEPNTNPMQTGRVINITEGQAVEHQDLALTRGGVITGRVTDAQGRPVVAQVVTLTPADETKPGTVNPLAALPFGNEKYTTDDRGVYRVYGLPAGRYLVSLGAAGGVGLNAFGKQRYHEQTFHPGVTDKAKAAVVELAEGAEVAGIDIRLGLASQTYKVSGRVVDAATGKPFTAAPVNYGATVGDAKDVSPSALGTAPNARGEFQVNGVIPGKYYAFAWFDDEGEFYSDAAPFEVTTADVTGVIVKVRRGQVVSGTVVVEGDGASPPSQPAELRLGAYNRSEEVSAPRQLTAKVASDGSFRLAGVQPGRLNFFYAESFFAPAKFVVLRTERGGIVQKEGVQIAAGESVNDIRVVLAIPSGTLRGEIKTSGDGSLDDYDLMVTATRVGGEPAFSRDTSEVDASGRFTIEGLVPGDYEVTVQANEGRAPTSKPPTAKQRVTVMKDTETSVTLSIELPAKKGKGK